MPCEAVYSFLLEDGSEGKTLIINGITCASLGHNIKGN